MPAEVTSSYAVSEGLPTAPGQYVIRWRGILVRDDSGKPVLFPSQATAQAEADELEKAAVND